MLTAGRPAPKFALTNQNNEEQTLAALRGHDVLVYFYPRADTPGCTTQACGLRDIADQVGDTVILGISPDKPAALAKFDDKYSLGLHAAVRPRPRGRRGLRRVAGEEELRQDVHGHRPLGVPDRRDGQGRSRPGTRSARRTRRRSCSKRSADMSAADLPAPADVLPHRPPFLFVDEIVALEPGGRRTGTLAPDRRRVVLRRATSPAARRCPAC